MVACRWWNQNSSTPVFRPHVRATKKGFASTHLLRVVTKPFRYGWASLLYRAATTCCLCCGQALEGSQGAGRIGLTHVVNI